MSQRRDSWIDKELKAEYMKDVMSCHPKDKVHSPYLVNFVVRVTPKGPLTLSGSHTLREKLPTDPPGALTGYMASSSHPSRKVFLDNGKKLCGTGAQWGDYT